MQHQDENEFTSEFFVEENYCSEKKVTNDNVFGNDESHVAKFHSNRRISFCNAIDEIFGIDTTKYVELSSNKRVSFSDVEDKILGNSEIHADKCRSNRRVSFSDVEVRLHKMELGDNPGVSYGPPLSISWNHFDSFVASIDEYESNKSQGEKLAMISTFDRIQLMTKAGYSLDEIRKRTFEVDKIKRKRERSIQPRSRFPSVPHLVMQLKKARNRSEAA